MRMACPARSFVSSSSLPGALSQTRPIMRFIAQKVSPHTYVNVMGQYYPAHLAHNPSCARGLKRHLILMT